MEAFTIKQAVFETSVALGMGYPTKLKQEIAMVGKSNVGKSSLINSLCNNFKLAKTSQTPGKTRLINFFRINEAFYLVDLPGYGFAKAPKSEQQKWGQLMEAYLSSGRVDHMFLLLDIRHNPTEEDKQMFTWILHYGIPFTLVATKGDKLAKSRRKVAAVTVARALGAPPDALVYSTKTQEGREMLLTRLGQIVEDQNILKE